MHFLVLVQVPFWQDEGTMQLVSAGLYAVVATSMSLINRFALLAFPLPTILLLLQMVATLLILYPLLATGVLNFPLFRRTRFWQLFGIASLYTANTAFALFGLKTLNLPMCVAGPYVQRVRGSLYTSSTSTDAAAHSPSHTLCPWRGVVGRTGDVPPSKTHFVTCCPPHCALSRRVCSAGTLPSSDSPP